ncbi:MAG: hypothetical protein WC960_00105 [Bacteroidales bacterium]
MQFAQIIGQKSLKRELINIVKEGRVAHSLLFVEAPTYGALPLSLALATYILCSNRGEEDSCGECQNCRLIKKLSHPDIHFSLPVNSGGKIKGEKRLLTDPFLAPWREAFIANPYITPAEWSREIGLESKGGFIGVGEASSLLGKLNLRSYGGREKCVIMWLPETMNREAANRLLKFFEEPPSATHIFMVSQSPEKLLATILSRCQLIRVPPIELPILEAEVEQKYRLSGEEAKSLAKVSGGSLSRVVELIKYSENSASYERELKALLEGSIERELTKVLEFSERVAQMGREEQKLFLSYSIEYIRAIIVLSAGADGATALPPSKEKELQYWSKKIKSNQLIRGYKLMEEALQDLNRNVNSKYLFADLSNRFYLYLK